MLFEKSLRRYDFQSNTMKISMIIAEKIPTTRLKKNNKSASMLVELNSFVTLRK